MNFRLSTIALTLACGFALFVAPGCKTDTAPSPGVGDPYPAPGNDPQISILSPELRPWLGFQPAVIERDGKRPMSVEVPMRNASYNKYLLEYRFLFYDNNGKTIEPTMGWQFVDVEPKQVVRLSGKALDLDAQNYRLEVKWSQ